MWILLVQRILRHLIRTGDLRLIMPDGSVFRLGDGQGETITVHLKSPDLPKRIALRPELAVGEGYMNGDLVIDDDDLTGFLTLLMQNYTQQRSAIWWQQPLAQLRRAIRRFDQFNPVGKAQANVAHHYDLSEALFKLFLDEDMQYSCAYFENGDESLEDAQLKKKRHIAAKLRLEDGQRILDIGCGWGGLAIDLARRANVEILGVTLSEEQHRIAVERAKASGVSDRVRFELRDYREVTDHFDRIVSVGMFEHVGVTRYDEFFSKVYKLLVDDGFAVLHSIGHMSPPSTASPWLRKYIFPGAYSPALSEVFAATERQHLWVSDVEVLRVHYADTLVEWNRRFQQNRARIAELYDERFCRMWEFYLISAETMFRTGAQMVFQMQLARTRDAALLTRDYMFATEESYRQADERRQTAA